MLNTSLFLVFQREQSQIMSLMEVTHKHNFLTVFLMPRGRSKREKDEKRVKRKEGRRNKEISTGPPHLLPSFQFKFWMCWNPPLLFNISLLKMRLQI